MSVGTVTAMNTKASRAASGSAADVVGRRCRHGSILLQQVETMQQCCWYWSSWFSLSLLLTSLSVLTLEDTDMRGKLKCLPGG